MRTCYIGEISDTHLNQIISLYGWVNHYRNHGKIIFVDLRDRTGSVQVIFSSNNHEIFQIAESLRNEYCIHITGQVNIRPKGMTNFGSKSGEIEILCKKIDILNASVTPPFQLNDNNISENTRLTHRVLDLRRMRMQNNLILRHNVSFEIRKFLNKLGFIDIETPILTKSTPEGARDYLVPSRVNSGNFFALPQSAQLFKQLLMIAGFDRCYQITKCFRDEDLRSDRQPEFTQIDCETSFLNELEIREIFEKMIQVIFKSILNVDLPKSFPVLSWKETILKYGSDKPDLRINLEFTDITDIACNINCNAFSLDSVTHHRAIALCIPNGTLISKNEIDTYNQFVHSYGIKYLSYIKVNKLYNGRDGLQSPIKEYLNDSVLSEILRRTFAKNRDIIFLCSGESQIVNDVMGSLRLKIAHSEFGRKTYLINEGWYPTWIIDFPMFHYDTMENRYIPVHHPFTSPRDGHEILLDIDPSKVFTKTYDMVINGCEIGGGSIRIHRKEIQDKVFNILKIDEKDSKEKFGFLLDALQYGAPPHGGIAFGLDRIIAIMVNAASIRDVIAFPKTQRAQCLLTQAPTQVVEKQLNELNINIRNNL